MISVTTQKTTNYMVPANGQTHAVTLSGFFSAAPFLQDWRQWSIDNEAFQPQGCFIDNTAGTVPLIINIQPINYNVVCPAGQTMQTQFPAPNGQTCTITGDPVNPATIYFVDFPVLPSTSQATILGTANVNIVGSTATVKVDPNPLAAGNTLPYREQEYVQTAEYHALSIAAGATTANVAPTANANLRKISVRLSGNATLAVAATVTLTLTLNGAQFYQDVFYVPNAIAAGEQSYVLCDEDFSFVAPGVGAAGTLVVTLSAALLTGTVTVNSYFGPQ